jgi:threonine/homoserine/homoserine lactone efflux protein
VPAASRLALFLPAALALLLVPGPSVLYIVTRSVQQGRRAGLVSVAGIHTATLVHIAAAAAGLSALLVRSAVLFTLVKYAGAAYLVVLGLSTLRHRDGGGSAAPVTAAPRAAWQLYRQGFVVNVLNPKTALFFLALLPQFVDVRRGHPAVQMTILGLTFLVMGAMTDSMYALVAARLGSRFADNPVVRRRQRRVTGGVLIGLGALTGLAPNS